MKQDNEYIILDVTDLHVHYKTKHEIVSAVNGVDIQIAKGETLGLVGETGAGKTTIALSIMKLLPVPPAKIEGGHVILDGINITSLSDKDMEPFRGDLVSMIFQDPMTSLNPVITVEDQIAEVYVKHQKLSREKSLAKAHEMLELVGVSSSRGKEYPHQFSGGMKQRVVIAIALACNPLLLIADEPTTALDVTIQAQILDMLNLLKNETKASMLMITHDLGIVAETCDKVSIIYAGRIIEHGTLEEIFDDYRHPYTTGLFDSLPKGNNKKNKLNPIGGELSDPSNLPTGCSFWPRCKHAVERCKIEAPQKFHLTNNHFVECHVVAEGGRK